MKGKTVREATYMLLRYQGITILTSPERFLSYLMDVADQTTREFELLRNACSEELLEPFYHALEPDSHVSLPMAALRANEYLLGMGSDSQLSMTLVQQIADGCMDYDKLQVTSGEEMSSGADESTKNQLRGGDSMSAAQGKQEEEPTLTRRQKLRQGLALFVGVATFVALFEWYAWGDRAWWVISYFGFAALSVAVTMLYWWLNGGLYRRRTGGRVGLIVFVMMAMMLRRLFLLLYGVVIAVSMGYGSDSFGYWYPGYSTLVSIAVSSLPILLIAFGMLALIRYARRADMDNSILFVLLGLLLFVGLRLIDYELYQSGHLHHFYPWGYDSWGLPLSTVPVILGVLEHVRSIVESEDA